VIVAAVVAVIFALAETDWGHGKVREIAVAKVNTLLGGRGTLYLGTLDGGLAGKFAVDSIALRDKDGALVFASGRVEAAGDVWGMVQGKVRFTRVMLTRPYLLIAQAKDGSWNVSKLFGPKIKQTSKSTLEVILDSAEVRDGHIALAMLDSVPTLPLVRHEFTKLNLVLGRTRAVHPDTSGGRAPLRHLSVEIDKPPVSIKDLVGTVNWWSDSLALDFPTLRLPRSHASLAGTINWANKGPAEIKLKANADSVALADIAWMTTLIPKSGGSGSALVSIHNAANPRDLAYEITKMDLRATKSRVGGAFTVVAGQNVDINNLNLTLQPLDLDLVREIFGDSVPKTIWQGQLAGTVRGKGGPLSRLTFSEIALTFTDQRYRGAVSHVTLAGAIDVKSKVAELHGMKVSLRDLDVHTLGAISKTADSLNGKLIGSLVLDGPTKDVRFHDLLIWHVDGDLPRSQISGAGHLASDVTTHWLDADLSLDTIAVATLARGQTTEALKGTAHGYLGLHALLDTVAIDMRLVTGRGPDSSQVHFDGATLLDSTRTWVRGLLTMTAFDPRAYFERKNIPVLKLTGTAEIDFSGNKIHSDKHADVVLDTSSVIGDSKIEFAQAKLGMDSSGFHVDTAEIRAPDWKMNARGRLAHDSTKIDTLYLSASFARLAPLRALWLDSLGKSFADSVRGAVSFAGTLIGSVDTLRVDADFGAQDIRYNTVTLTRAVGHAALSGLPNRATGLITMTADSAAAAGFTVTRMHARADVTNGDAARFRIDGTSGDTLSAIVLANAVHRNDSTYIALDSLSAVLGAAEWKLAKPTAALVTSTSIAIDSTVLRSSKGGIVAFRASLPDRGAASGSLRIENFGPEEIAFTGRLSPDLSALFHATATLTGTRDAPVIDAAAGLDSVKIGPRAAPSIAATAHYASKHAIAEAHGMSGTRDVLTLTANVPIDLTLRSVEKRLLDDTLTARFIADSASLAGLESVVPQVQGLAGNLFANVDMRGTWKHVNADGRVEIRDGAFEFSKSGTVGRGVTLDARLFRDSIVINKLRMSDVDNLRDTASATGSIWKDKSGWKVNLASVGRNFNVMDDPRLATVNATWTVNVKGALKQPTLGGQVFLPAATFVIGQSRKVRQVRGEPGMEGSELAVGEPLISNLQVTLGNDVRLKSAAANVQLSGSLEILGQVSNPFVYGEIQANRGTYRIDLSVLKRTFRVDSGLVRLAGPIRDVPATLDIWTSYLVRQADKGDVQIVAHLTGTTDSPRLELGSADLGTSAAQSEIISYLIFGSPSFAIDGGGSSTVKTATAALVPSLGGVLEGVLGSLLPFFNSLQVTTVAGSGPQSLTTNPLDGLLNSFALTAGRQLGSDTFLNISGGVCRGSRIASAQSLPAWFGLSAEYRPKAKVGVIASMDPGSSPCSRSGRFLDVYQFGVDVFRDWRFK
jgi:translocation and assembly module TamB